MTTNEKAAPPPAAAADGLHAAYLAWPEDIRKKLSLHDLRRMSGWAPKAPMSEWRIDTSAGGPILVHKDCSVIEGEQARYVIGLIERDQAPPAAARGDVRGLVDYDAGLLNDFGGGDVIWWQDYLRAEIERANEFWREQTEQALAAEGVQAGEVEQRAREREMLCRAVSVLQDWRAHLRDTHSIGVAIDRIAKFVNGALAQPNVYDYMEQRVAKEMRGLKQAALSQQPEARGVVDEVVALNAERYEWLRENCEIDSTFCDVVRLTFPLGPEVEGFDTLDEAVDAALTGERNG